MKEVLNRIREEPKLRKVIEEILVNKSVLCENIPPEMQLDLIGLATDNIIPRAEGNPFSDIPNLPPVIVCDNERMTIRSLWQKPLEQMKSNGWDIKKLKI